MRKIATLLGVLLLFSNCLLAQTRQISGKITDAGDNSPLAGVTVTAKGTKSAVITGPDGSFTIHVSPKATTLHVSYIGYEDKDIPFGSGTEPLSLALARSKSALSEVVVVGYGKASKKDITGSISRLDAKAVENYPAPSFESAIQGKAPGVVVTSGSGRVGEAIQINIRGISSISASSQPLYVVDGLPVTTASLSDANNNDTDPLADINPNDIESIDILKDASAAAIYGARAANGVVLITTKKGKNSRKTNLELNTSTGISNPARQRKFMDAKQYLQFVHDAANNDGYEDFTQGISGYPSLDSAQSDYFNNTSFGYTSFFAGDNGNLALGTDWQNAAVNTNWQKASLHHNAPNHQINLSASGGNDKTRFFISGFYNTQDAIVINNTFSRYGARFNIDHNATDKLIIGLNLAVDRSQLNKVTNDNSFSTPGELVAQLPLSPYLDPATGLPNNNTLYPSGIYDAIYDFDHQTTFRTIGNGYLNYTFFPALSFRSEIGADILALNENEFAGKESQDGGGLGNGTTIFSQSVTLNTNNYFTFTPNIGDDSKLNVVLGNSYQQNDLFHSFAQGQSYPTDGVKNLAGATNITGASSTDNRYTFLSYFLRGNYTLDNKYLFSASIREDGSSRFAPSHRYGWFPSVSAGWLLSEENFLKNSRTISMLKLRASYGQTGNSEIGESRFQSLYSVTNYPNLPGFSPTQLGSPDLRWEKSQQEDVGVEFGFFKSRITGELDYYHKHSTDLLLNTNIPLTTGYGSITQNLGKVDNQGVELTITSQNLTGDFKWTTNFNVGYNKNRVGNIGGQIIESSDQLQRAIDGAPIGTWYMQKFAGVDPATGDALYLDATGKATTNDYSQAGRFNEGKYTPDYTAGLTNTFSYKGIDLTVFFYGVTGNKIYNSAGTFMTDGFANFNLDNQTVDELNTWTHPGQITNTPRAGIYFGSGGHNSTQYLYDGSYLRLKNLALGYTLPHAAINALKISSARIYVSGTNIFTSTKYPSDPEVSTIPVNSVGGGEDFYTIPQPRTFTVGLNVKF
jgi:TonB-dependent starch-binding outer membrane protein SusC